MNARSGRRMRAVVMVALLSGTAFLTQAQPHAVHGAARYLEGRDLRDALADVTFIGNDWAEYYTTDGVIIGLGRWMGMVRRYTGRWTLAGDHVCYHYGHKDFDTCSRLSRQGDRVLHFALDGRPKKDGNAARFPGDRLSEFR